ncbi:YbaB/EbfC family nucleoid-associated protein [Amycolatopsis silviterrae]|uniref:YbaB/EbfC family nucleoid-associated protein n=1 Tax=Amycolatopsis silviterrae TaxID=1656914 RepID=A0ABW5HL43_9PSEU
MDDNTARIAALAEGIRTLRDAVPTQNATADSPDGLIRATVDGYGKLVELELHPRILRDPDSRALADAVIGTVHAAQETVGRKIAGISRNVLPPLDTAVRRG